MSEAVIIQAKGCIHPGRPSRCLNLFLLTTSFPPQHPRAPFRSPDSRLRGPEIERCLVRFVILRTTSIFRRSRAAAFPQLRAHLFFFPPGKKLFGMNARAGGADAVFPSVCPRGPRSPHPLGSRTRVGNINLCNARQRGRRVDGTRHAIPPPHPEPIKFLFAL